MAAKVVLKYHVASVKDTLETYVILPQKKHVRCNQSPEIQLSSFKKNWPVLLFLHDSASDPEDIWATTKVACYADEAEIAVIMPTGHLSYFSNYSERDVNAVGKEGGIQSNASIESGFTELLYADYVYETLKTVRRIFPVLKDPTHTAIGGIGMGGFGAFKNYLLHKDEFSSVFSISGEIDIQIEMNTENEKREQFQAVFGSLNAKGADDLPSRYEELKNSGTEPKLLQIWAEDGENAQMNESFAAKYQGATDYRTIVEPGKNDYEYYDNAIKNAFIWLKGNF